MKLFQTMLVCSNKQPKCFLYAGLSFLRQARGSAAFMRGLVKAVKAPLKKVLGRSMIWKKELETVLTEIEDLVNSRPLTCVSTEDAFSQPLTACYAYGKNIRQFRTARQ